MSKKILIVDDDPIMGNLLETRLYGAGFETDYIDSAEYMAAEAQQFKPDIMVINISLTGIDGYELHSRIRQNTETKSIPILFIAPDTEPIERLEPFRANGDDFIFKPFKIEDLLTRIQNIPGKKLQEKPIPVPHNSDSSAGNDMPFFDALKRAEQESFTGMLEISGTPELSSVFFQDGRVVNAAHGMATGKKALYRIFSETGISVSFHSQPVNIKTIDSPLHLLIEEGNKEVDVLKRLKPETFEDIVSIDDQALEKTTEVKNNPGLQKTLSLVKQHNRVKEILDASQTTDLHTYKHLVYLTKMGILNINPNLTKINIRIVTDSSADLPPEIVRERNITQIPISVVFDQKTYLDKKDIFPDQFYRLLKSSNSFPQTSPPSENDFDILFKTLAPENDILGIFLSKRMSQTVDHAIAARKNHFDGYLKQRQQISRKDGIKIEILDSQTVSLGMGLLVMEAADKIDEGWEFEKISEYIQSLIPLVRVFFVPDKLDYLQHGGKISKTRRWIGNFLRMKPILSIHNGDVVSIDQAVGDKNAQQLVVELIRQQLVDSTLPIKIGIMHADAPKSAEQMKELLQKLLNCQQMTISYIGPSVASHCGPGTIAVACLPFTSGDEKKSPWR